MGLEREHRHVRHVQPNFLASNVDGTYSSLTWQALIYFAAYSQ